MLLAYVDESYAKGKAWFYLATLLVRDDQAVSLALALEQVAERAAASYGVPVDADLHGHELFQAKGPWACMARHVRARIGIYGSALQAISDHDAKLILCGVHGDGLKRRYARPLDPHKIALAHALERIDGLAAAREEYALVIADEVAEAAQHRADLRAYQALGVGAQHASKLPWIADTIHFAPSKASRLVQAADLVAFLYHRIERVKGGDERSLRANRTLWNRIKPQIIHDEFWYPASEPRVPRQHKGPASAGPEAGPVSLEAPCPR